MTEDEFFTKIKDKLTLLLNSKKWE
jgi:hypothetical protein